MSKVYIVFIIILLSIAFGLVLLPNISRDKQLEPELLLKEIIDPSRFISPDLLAERIINEDPSLLLVDVRTPDEYGTYSLPEAINIPLVTLTNPDQLDLLASETKEVVLFSNDDLFADQAWIIFTRLGYKNIFVLKGGLNQWFSDIILPAEPTAFSSQKEFDLYSFRKAASQYFKGTDTPTKESANQSAIPVKKREKKSGTVGGC